MNPGPVTPCSNIPHTFLSPTNSRYQITQDIGISLHIRDKTLELRELALAVSPFVMIDLRMSLSAHMVMPFNNEGNEKKWPGDMEGMLNKGSYNLFPL